MSEYGHNSCKWVSGSEQVQMNRLAHNVGRTLWHQRYREFWELSRSVKYPLPQPICLPFCQSNLKMTKRLTSSLGGDPPHHNSHSPKTPSVHPDDKLSKHNAPFSALDHYTGIKTKNNEEREIRGDGVKETYSRGDPEGFQSVIGFRLES